MAAQTDTNSNDAALRRALSAHTRIALDLARGDHSHAARYAPMGRRGRGQSGVVAFAGWDGTIHLQPEILSHVDSLFEGPAAVRRSDQLVAMADSLHTCLHEHAHLIVPAGRTYAENALAYAKWPVHVIEEGTTEAWAQDNLSRFLQHHERLAPGLSAHAADTRSYATFVPAIRQIAQNLGGRLGITGREVIASLNRRGAASKLAMVAYLGLRAGDAWEHVPAQHRQRCVFTVAGVVSKVLEGNRKWAELDGKGQARVQDGQGRSAIMGLQAVAAIDRTVRELRHRHVVQDRDWHRTSLEYEVALARYGRGLSRGRDADTGQAASEWYADAKAKLQRARTKSVATSSWRDAMEPASGPVVIPRTDQQRAADRARFLGSEL